MKTRCRFLCAGVMSLLLVACAFGQEKSVDFARDIQPILLKRCVECHGPDKQKGGLRLDLKAEAFKDASVLVPHKAQESELYQRITLPADHDDIMPPSGDPLSQAQTDLIRDWINQGAVWPEALAIQPASAAKITQAQDPRQPVQPSPEEQQAIAQLQALGVQIRAVAMNASWTVAHFRGLDPKRLDEAMPLLAQVATLEDLHLAGLPLKDDHLRHLAGLVNLTRLHLERTPVTDAGLVYLKGLVHLKYLNLYDTAVTDAGLAHLEGLKSLKNIFLWQTQVTEEGANQLRAALPQTDVNRGWETPPTQPSAPPEDNPASPAKEENKAG